MLPKNQQTGSTSESEDQDVIIFSLALWPEEYERLTQKSVLTQIVSIELKSMHGSISCSNVYYLMTCVFKSKAQLNFSEKLC